VVERVDDTPVYLLKKLEVRDAVEGPAMTIDDTQSVVIVPGVDEQAFITLKYRLAYS